MKRRGAITVFILACSMHSFCQGEADNWYFSRNGGLSFKTGSPNIIPGSPMRANVSSSSISDKRGNLLFYTNGEQVYNRYHTLMLNGSGLHGSSNASQGSIIIPVPESNNLFYIFTVGCFDDNTNGLEYNIVDMNADNGRGDVIKKNVSLLPGAREKLTAIKHCNKRDIWVITHEKNNDKYYAYLVTSNGIVPPAISRGNYSTSDLRGSFKIWRGGTRAAAYYSGTADVIELMNFDRKTGGFANSVTFRINPTYPQYIVNPSVGIEFSPNGNLLYVTYADSAITKQVWLFQFDISSFNTSTIELSKRIIYVADNIGFPSIVQGSPYPAGGQIALAKDNKLYIQLQVSSYQKVTEDDNSVRIVHKPDVYGDSCNFQYNGISFGNPKDGIIMGRCLPNFVTDFLDSLSSYDIVSPRSCTDRNVKFGINTVNGIDSVLWKFDDNTTSTSLSPTHTFLAGRHSISLVVYSQNCGAAIADTILKTIWIAPSSSFLPHDTTVCEGTAVKAGFEVSDANYSWSTGETNSFINIKKPGIYYETIEVSGCRLTDSIVVSMLQAPKVNLGNDTALCSHESLILDAGIGSTYR
ncbi:MAG: PKD domain-containing protein, partial [Bacteroidota bacterium]|nr:PKD domain-containing protein [Bacteroidota bacterium]